MLGGQAGRLGAGPPGAKRGGDSGPEHQGLGARGAPWAAPSPWKENLPYLGPLYFVWTTNGEILRLLLQPCPIPIDGLPGFLL